MTSRRTFIMSSLGAGATLPVLGRLIPASARELPAELVLAFVRDAHTNLAQTRQRLEREPRLLRVAYEWAPGDFETAIDAAAHTGSVGIVRFLLERGAPYTIFVAATLGHLETIRAVTERIPEVIRARGPHGIPLLDHALAGGAAASPVAEYLAANGAEGQAEPADLPVPPELEALLIGRYLLEADGRTLEFEVTSGTRGLHVLAEGRPAVRLLHQGQARFALEGTPAELIFEVHDRPCQRVMLREGRPIGVARRVDRDTAE